MLIVCAYRISSTILKPTWLLRGLTSFLKTVENEMSHIFYDRLIRWSLGSLWSCVFCVCFFNEKFGVISDTLSNSVFLSAWNRGQSQMKYVLFSTAFVVNCSQILSWAGSLLYFPFSFSNGCELILYLHIAERNSKLLWYKYFSMSYAVFKFL